MPNDEAWRYRDFAREIREQAERSPRPEIKAALLRIADQYDRLAGLMEPPNPPEK
jgi:hypothetical protein